MSQTPTAFDAAEFTDRLDRRALLIGLGALSIAAPIAPALARATGRVAPQDAALSDALRALEARSGGRLGVAVFDGRDGAVAGHRLDTRFAMCSTFKLSLAAAVLARIDAGRIAPSARLLITRADPVGHSPVVRARLAAGESSMTVLDLCQAAQMQSDNGAANILLRKIGGPAALTAFWQRLGDRTSRLDRYEPGLNLSHDGDPRDTTTPGAMARSLHLILAGPVLEPAARDQLIDWTIATQTGAKRLRAGLPADWRAGDKTGTMNGDPSIRDKYNDVAVCWRPGRAAPFLITAFFESPVKGSRDGRAEDEAVLAQAGRLAAGWISARV